ncbi:MAG: NAD(P)/FAD-dependent oxidoreductase [Methermicoccaceae archaeon]
MKLDADVIIVGAGPAGLYAAWMLSEPSHEQPDVLIIDMGRDVNKRKCKMGENGKCVHCTPCDVMCGVGGAGTFSDGTLNLRPDIGGDLTQFIPSEAAWKIVNEVDSVLVQCGAPDTLSIPRGPEVEALERRAASIGARFIPIPQRHMGSDNTPKIIGRFKEVLEERGVRFMLKTEVDDLIIDNGSCKGVILSDNRKLFSSYVLLSPGRVGVSWVGELCDKHRISSHHGPIDVGVRVEVPSIVMDPITNINRDPKFHIRTRRYDDFVRTFCTNERGFVVKEDYNGFIATNGHSFQNRESENTNFAFLVRIELTEPLENTTKYGKSIAKLASTIGGGKPVLQRMGDLRKGRRSTWKRLSNNPMHPTLQDVTPGDISMALPHRIVMDIIEGLETLDKIVPGVAADSVLLYAPEIKFYARVFDVSKTMETNIENLFAAGDGAGLSRDIVNASATGILAARGILEKMGAQVKKTGS